MWGRVNLYTAPGYPFHFSTPVFSPRGAGAAGAAPPDPCSAPLGNASGGSAADAEYKCDRRCRGGGRRKEGAFELQHQRAQSSSLSKLGLFFRGAAEAHGVDIVAFNWRRLWRL